MANVNFSLAHFNAIAAGHYNAGDVVIRTDQQGNAVLDKVNNHVTKTHLNNVTLSAEEVISVKESFLDALARGGVEDGKLAEIRAKLGLPAEMSASDDLAAQANVMERRFKPLTRAEVREILDDYANGGRGFGKAQEEIGISYANYMAGQATRNMSDKDRAKQARVNTANALNHEVKHDPTLLQRVALVSCNRTIGQLDAERNKAITGANAAADRQLQTAGLGGQFAAYFKEALKMLSDGVRESGTFLLFGETAKLVKENDGKISVVLGEGAVATKVRLDADANRLVGHLAVKALNDIDLLGKNTFGTILDAVYDHDLDGILTAEDRTSLTRKFAASVLAYKAEDVDADALVNGAYNTGLLVETAQAALDGKVTTLAKLQEYHDKIKRDNAGLDDDMKRMLADVANMPLEKPGNNSEMIVHAPIAGDVQQIADAVAAGPVAAPQPVPAGQQPVPAEPRPVTAQAVKDFVADLVFSDDTMVADVVVNRPGELMRKFLTDPKRIDVFTAIVKDPALLGGATAPDVVQTLKDGFAKMSAALDGAWGVAHPGETLAQAAAKEDFAARFAAFLKSPKELPGKTLAAFDNILQSMSNAGCEQIQVFINKVFGIDPTKANAIGALTNEPYKNKTAAEIKAELTAKSLNEILDASSNSDAPGQVGFFKQVVSSYFTTLAKSDKRSCFAASMRYADAFDFVGLEGEARESAKKAAVNKFAGAILKGTSPLLQKMMQGLPKEIMGGFADALADMKANLAPIPRKVVQAHLAKLVKDSGGKIHAIELVKSLGAASVGEAFLCKFTVVERRQKFKYENNKTKLLTDDQGNPIMEEVESDKQCVVKIMRHDAEQRVEREARIFTEAAAKIPGMAKTWEGQLKQYMKEFDFRIEAENVKEGFKLYGIADGENPALGEIAEQVSSMKLSTLALTQKNVMVAEVAIGQTVDSYFKTNTDQIRNAVGHVFQTDPSTGRILWQDGPADPKTGAPTKVPVVKPNFVATAPSNIQQWVASNYEDLRTAQDKILQATKAWFHEALLGSGKFHGDAHSGNLMVAFQKVTFIDFGNLYKLETHYETGPNGEPVMEDYDIKDEDGEVIGRGKRKKVALDERCELLRLILGATLRNKDFFLAGFERLLSPEGKLALAANREKAVAILDAVLAKGKFSYDVAYRLQAAAAELQKLGLELPPQVNCFIQSMVRLQNTVSEMNTIMNQAKALLDATTGLVKPPAGPRDEMDFIGPLLDFKFSEAGHKMVRNRGDYVMRGAEKITAFQNRLFSAELGGQNTSNIPALKEGGEYFEKCRDRLAKAANPVVEARRLVDLLRPYANPENDTDPCNGNITNATLNVDEFERALAAAQTPEAKAAAIRTFADEHCKIVAAFLSTIKNAERALADFPILPPNSFASAVMGVLFGGADAVANMIDKNFTAAERTSLMFSVKAKSVSELHLGWFAGQETIINAIIEDSQSMGGDTSYKVDIGV